MQELFSCYDKLKAGERLSRSECQELSKLEVGEAQLASLTILLLGRPTTEHESVLVKATMKRYPAIKLSARVLFPDHPGLPPQEDDDGSLPDTIRSALIALHRGSSAGAKTLKDMLVGLASGQISSTYMAVWLAAVVQRGLLPADLRHLTDAMVSSGRIYDYREAPSLSGRRIVRRYPTGALSEKTALIMPSVLCSLAKDYRIASTVLVARSLSFTGGTWDKLSAIPGFTFPNPGPETVEVLRRCWVAMCVTTKDFNPADRALYELRSRTGTVESHDLIVASIASKHLACPPHQLLLDVRFGHGAFMRTEFEAQRLEELLLRVLREGGIPSDSVLRDTPEPTGVAIGNATELAESVAIMAGRGNEPPWDYRASVEQVNVVSDSVARLMNNEHPEVPIERWQREVITRLDDGRVLSSFKEILAAHAVTQPQIEALCRDPLLFVSQMHSREVRSRSRGRLVSVDQRRIGYIIAFELNDASSSALGQRSSVILRKRLADEIERGDVLCDIYLDGAVHSEKAEALLSGCFVIS